MGWGIGWLVKRACNTIMKTRFWIPIPGWQVVHPKHTCSLPLRGRSREDCWGLLAFSPFEKMRAPGSRRGPAQNKQEECAGGGHPTPSSALHTFAQVCAPMHTSAHTLTQAFRNAHINNTLFFKWKKCNFANNLTLTFLFSLGPGVTDGKWGVLRVVSHRRGG